MSGVGMLLLLCVAEQIFQSGEVKAIIQVYASSVSMKSGASAHARGRVDVRVGALHELSVETLSTTGLLGPECVAAATLPQGTRSVVGMEGPPITCSRVLSVVFELSLHAFSLIADPSSLQMPLER